MPTSKQANASEAYRQVYDTNASAKTINEKASRLLAEGKVRARFEALQGKVTERAVEKTAISKAWVIEKLVENVERAMQAEAVVDREGKETGEFTYNGNVANRALELIGKELGMFIDRREVGEPNEFAHMTNEELKAFIAEPDSEIAAIRNANGQRPKCRLVME